MSDLFDAQLVRTDARSLASEGVAVVLVARNEGFRLPAFFAFYRARGVKRFYVVDDHSTDETASFLEAQPDCATFTPRTGYAASLCGRLWQEAILDRYCRDAWVLVVDADELFTPPHAETVSIPALCAYLDSQGKTAMAGFMLDMYPAGDLAEANFAPGQPFTDVCPFFDADYRFPERFVAYMPFRRKALPTFEVIGGPRARLFYPEQSRADVFSRLKNRLVWRFAALLDRLGLWRGELPHPAPALHKVPLVKWNGTLRYVSAHTIQGGILAEERCVLLHFKFFAAFHAKAVEESARGEHFQGGREYKRYLETLARAPHLSFCTERSLRYASSDDVLAAGLLRSTRAFDACAARTSASMAK